MNAHEPEIVRREFRHGKVAYRFHWNKSNHENIGNTSGDAASLWAHLNSIVQGKISEEPFTNPFYQKASSLRFKKMSKVAKVSFRKKLERSGLLRTDEESDLIQLLRALRRARSDGARRADHGILVEFLFKDPKSIAIEVPVWSNAYNLSGHIDLVRIVDDTVHVCDYKPGPLESTSRRFFDSIPQVSAYGEMLSHHLASTLRSALDAPLLPKVQCCIFDSHSSWYFGAEMYVTLLSTGMLKEI